MFKKYGISESSNHVFFKLYGLNKRSVKSKFPVARFEKFFNHYLKEKIIERQLFDHNRADLSFLKSIKSYRGLRHKNKYPVRGQRTHTNATKKVFKFPKI